jgi:glycosyltransferase involved in cell wall biosynthesis
MNDILSPKVSVLMSVYNGALYLRDSMDSIIKQTFKDFEFIIIDDCSTDDTWKILSEYANKDHRIKLFKNDENIGLTKSLNKGLSQAKGKYIARQDADDISLGNRFDRQIDMLDENPEVVLVSCDIEWINAEGFPLDIMKRSCPDYFINWYLLFYNHLSGHSQVMFRRQQVLELGGYSEAYRYSQDYELWCRLSKVGKFIILPEVLLQQRSHNRSVSAEKKAEQEAYVLTQVKHNIKLLTADDLSLVEAKKLKEFWVGHLSSFHFPDSQEIHYLNDKLKHIFRAFLQQCDQSTYSDPKIQQQLRSLIGKQFIRWMSSLNIRRYPIAKIKTFLCAFTWHPTLAIEDALSKFL